MRLAWPRCEKRSKPVQQAPRRVRTFSVSASRPSCTGVSWGTPAVACPCLHRVAQELQRHACQSIRCTQRGPTGVRGVHTPNGKSPSPSDMAMQCCSEAARHYLWVTAIVSDCHCDSLTAIVCAAGHEWDISRSRWIRRWLCPLPCPVQDWNGPFTRVRAHTFPSVRRMYMSDLSGQPYLRINGTSRGQSAQWASTLQCSLTAARNIHVAEHHVMHGIVCNGIICMPTDGLRPQKLLFQAVR